MKIIFLDWVISKHDGDGHILRHHNNNDFYFRVYKIGGLYRVSLSGSLYYYLRDNEIGYNMWEAFKECNLENAIADVEKYVKYSLNGKILKELNAYI